jgi:hypothetical protein
VLTGVGLDIRTPLVPNVIGMDLARAEAELTAAGFVRGQIREVTHPDIPRGSVSDQVPRGGTPLDQGGEVDLVVSTGPETVAVPDVVAEDLSEATALLQKARLRVGTVTEQADESNGANVVLASRPVAETVVLVGSPVDLIVAVEPPAPETCDLEGQVRDATGKCSWPPCDHENQTQDPATGKCSWPPCDNENQTQDPATGKCSWPPCDNENQTQDPATGKCSWPPCDYKGQTQDPATGKCTCPTGTAPDDKTRSCLSVIGLGREPSPPAAEPARSVRQPNARRPRKRSGGSRRRRDGHEHEHRGGHRL